MNTKNAFVKDSFITLIRQITSIIIGVLLIVIIARGLGPELQGQYTLITVFPLLITMFLNLGLNISTVYFVSKGEINLNEAFTNNLVIGVILSGISVFVGLVFINLWGNQLFPEIHYKYLYLILITVPFILMNSFFQTIFQGIQNFKIFNTVLVITQLTNLALVILLVIWFKIGLFGALISFLLGHVITFIFILWVFLFKYKVTINKHSLLDPSYIKKSISYGLKSYLSNLVTFLNYRQSLFFIGYFISPLAVGLYSVSINVAEKLSVFTQSISTVLLPKIASLRTDAERNELTSIVSRFTLTFMLILIIPIFFLSDFIVRVLFGLEYIQSSLFLKILLPGIAFLAVEKILSNDIAARGKPEVNMYVSIFNVVFSVILNLILIPIYGVLGAAVTTSFIYSVSFCIKSYLFSKITGERLSSFILIKKKDLILLSKFIIRITKKKGMTLRGQ